VVLGDFNIAPEDRDVHDPLRWNEDSILTSTAERAALARLLGLGLHDSFRLHNEEAGHFSWWDYRAAGLRRNLGLRIDLALVSEGLKHAPPPRTSTASRAVGPPQRPRAVFVELEPRHELGRPAQRHRSRGRRRRCASRPAPRRSATTCFGDDPTVNALQERVAASSASSAAVRRQRHAVQPDRADGALRTRRRVPGRQRGAHLQVRRRRRRRARLDPAAAGAAAARRHAAAGCARARDQAAGDSHFARTRLLALENTWNGRALPPEYVGEAGALARRHGLGFHLDGARLYNAAVARGVPPREIARGFDSVSICFSKGLGAPVGSMLLGDTALVERARRWRKVVGGGWRQAGLLAAMAGYALDHHVARLAEDHARAARLASALRALPGLAVDGPHTNMVFVTLPADASRTSPRTCRRARSAWPARPVLRLVTHLDVDDAALERAIGAFRDFFR
jgi:threonine aldolase